MIENTNLTLTVEAWAEITIDNWLDKIDKMGIGYTFSLESDIRSEVISSASYMPSQVSFNFPFYGKFVDMGVGRGVRLEDVTFGRQDHNARQGGHRRRPKPWYSKTFYAEVMKLSKILASKNARLGALIIVETICDNESKII